MSFPCVLCYDDVRPRQHALECDSCLRWQHRTCGSGVTVLEYRNWTGDQEYICSVCRDAEPEPSVDIEDTETVSERDVSMVDALEGSIPSLDGTFIIEQQDHCQSFNVSAEFEEEEAIC